MKLEVVILAAGKGTRMYSDTPKVLHRIGARSMLGHVVDAARSLEAKRIHVVVGFAADTIREAFSANQDISWVVQQEQLGTGHAVRQALPGIEDDSTVLVLYGDVPLIKSETLGDLIAQTVADSVSVLTLRTGNPEGLGRIIRDDSGAAVAIVEEKDASQAQKQITEINSGILSAPARNLKQWLGQLTTDNAQGEYYLTDIIAMAAEAGQSVNTTTTEDEMEVQGVNNRLQLSILERQYQSELAEGLLRQGVTLRDPSRLDIRGETLCGRDVELDVNVILEGKVKIGSRVRVGPNVVIKDSVIGDDTLILANSHLEGVRIGANCSVGPFARLRPGTNLSDQSKIGNFVETKKSTVGVGSKVNHLSYIGDAVLGNGVNIGAGTITCNYDGVNKSQTLIEDGVFVGSNSALVAPVSLGQEATIAAGSTITADVPEKNLAVARSRQKNIENWNRPKKRSEKFSPSD